MERTEGAKERGRLITYILIEEMSNLHKKLQKTMTKPVHLLFRYYQSRSRIQIWLYQQPDLRIEGKIIVLRDWD